MLLFALHAGFYDEDDNLVTKVTNVVAIRPRGYIKAATPPADNEFASSRLEDVEALLRERFLSRMHIKIAPEKLDRDTLLARLREEDMPTSEPVDRVTFDKYLAFMELHKKLDESQRGDLFALLDRDQNGEIDVGDFLSWYNSGGLASEKK